MVDKERLKEYIWIQRNIETLEDMLLEVDTKLQSATSHLTLDKISTTKNPDKFGDLIADRIKIEQSINDEIQIGLKEMKYIEEIISSLSERDKLLMRLRYIRGHRWEQICVELNYEWAQTHRNHARILDKLKRDTK